MIKLMIDCMNQENLIQLFLLSFQAQEFLLDYERSNDDVQYIRLFKILQDNYLEIGLHNTCQEIANIKVPFWGNDEST